VKARSTMKRVVLAAGVTVLFALGLAVPFKLIVNKEPNLSDATGSLRTVPVPRSQPAISEHVVVVSIDGLRPDGLSPSTSETIWELIDSGSYTLDAQTILPSSTLPSHASMLSGVEPSVHGILWNDDDPPVDFPDVFTVFDLVSEAGLTGAAFFGKRKLAQLLEVDEVQHLEIPGRWAWGQRHAGDTVEEVREYLEAGAEPSLLFVHLGEPDWAGHDHGWLSEEYWEAVAEADEAIGVLLQVLDTHLEAGEYTLIVTADHGGSGYTHGGSDPESLTIPWIAWGEGVRTGSRLTDPVRTTDTAATIAWLLGLEMPAAWNGRPIKSAYSRSQ
jgi:predicted AlkP superfamily pyrophosphatase or phosphodiesterase